METKYLTSRNALRSGTYRNALKMSVTPGPSTPDLEHDVNIAKGPGDIAPR